MLCISYICYSNCRKTREEQKDKIKSTVLGNCIEKKRKYEKERMKDHESTNQTRRVFPIL
jgi:hypothetical protein